MSTEMMKVAGQKRAYNETVAETPAAPEPDAVVALKADYKGTKLLLSKLLLYRA